LNSKLLLSEYMDMKDKRRANAGLPVSPSSRIHKLLQLPSYKCWKKITVCSRMPKISSSSNTIVPYRSEFLHLVATRFGVGYIIAKKFRAVFNQCRQEEEEEENTVLTYFCSKFYTCPASNLQKTRSSKLVRHSKHTCGRRQKALLRRERERERERERGRALRFLFLQSSPASTLGCYDYRAQCFFRVVIVLSNAWLQPIQERMSSADHAAAEVLQRILFHTKQTEPQPTDHQSWS
jgi:hypothetical protein